MSVIEAVILGLVQGLTEFLPISSSGHLELFSAILNVQNSESLLFSVVVHGATAASTIVVFRKDIAALFNNLFVFHWNYETRFIKNIVLSSVPVAIVGLLFEEQIELLFSGKILMVGFMLLITGLLLTFTHYAPVSGSKEISSGKAIIVGIAQALAIMPGISRSGATIASSILLKIDKKEATKFSFLMVLIPILGASLLKTIKFLGDSGHQNQIGTTALLIGFISAFISGLFACNWMVNLVRKGKLYYFAIYCFAIGIISIIVGAS
ncbi:MAG: undecaprenyl-diphosphate phosphatase [Bacteroidota bacterium]